jgi:hypothetical protein
VCVASQRRFHSNSQVLRDHLLDWDHFIDASLGVPPSQCQRDWTGILR